MKKEDPKEIFLLSEDLKNESEKPVASRDPFNWKELSIGKQGDEHKIETPNTLETNEKLGGGNKGEYTGFDWENIRIGKEPIDDILDSPKLFEEETEEANPQQKRNVQNQEFDLVNVATIKQDKLLVDKDNLIIAQRAESKVFPSSPPKVKPREQGSKISLLKKITSFLFSLFILAIIISAVVSIMINLELISKDQADRLTTFVLSKLPIGVFQRSEDRVVVSQHSGRWVSTRNGLIYVVSGDIANNSQYEVSYIRIRGEFLSSGKKLYEQVVYAGNTFSDNELKTIPFEDILNKLQRKNGDINVNFPSKPAGLNYGVKPRETVPFFIVFPSKGRVLGLKYNINLVDFEKANLE